jgi:c-di-GMP-binding flagellar brake protein YcgR
LLDNEADFFDNIVKMTEPNDIQQIQNIFTRVNNASEKRTILHKLSESRIHLNIKGEKEEDLYSLRIAKLTGKEITCLIPNPSPKIKLGKKVTCSFIMGSERYFFYTQVWVSRAAIVLDTNFELYKLQRRNHYRIDVPERLKAFLEIRKHNDNASKLKLSIIDLSGGGVKCRALATSDLKFNVGDQIEAILTVPGKASLEVLGEIRYTDVKDVAGKDYTYCGVKFLDIKASLERRLFNLVLDIHRDVNSIFKE